MKYEREVRLKTGEVCILRSAGAEDAKAYLDIFRLTHEESDFLLTYPEESNHTEAEYAETLQRTLEDPKALELCAFLNGKMVGTAGFEMLRNRIKLRHRATYGISIIREQCGKGLGSLLTQICIERAREAGFLQLELEVVADNTPAIALYQKHGFREFGRNPRGFRTREGQWQALVEMRLELDR